MLKAGTLRRKRDVISNLPSLLQVMYYLEIGNRKSLVVLSLKGMACLVVDTTRRRFRRDLKLSSLKDYTYHKAHGFARHIRDV
jgi:hypothetical protein